MLYLTLNNKSSKHLTIHLLLLLTLYLLFLLYQLFQTLKVFSSLLVISTNLQTEFYIISCLLPFLQILVRTCFSVYNLFIGLKCILKIFLTWFYTLFIFHCVKICKCKITQKWNFYSLCLSCTLILNKSESFLIKFCSFLIIFKFDLLIALIF